jgi:Iodothyronine deiodinase
MHVHWNWRLCCFAALAWLPLTARAEDPKPYAVKLEQSSGESVTRALDDSWPARPEWVDMLTDILQGSQLGPNDGWFRRAVAQTRFDWGTVRQRFDRDGDGRVARAEIRASDSDFARLDRDQDRVLTEVDFDFSPHALTATPGAILFYRADRDGNGRITRDEFDALFQQLGGGQEFLSLADLQEAFHTPVHTASGAKAPSGPSKETLVRGLFRQELGSLQTGPALGEKAPDFKLKTHNGKGELSLSKLVGAKPVVLVFGNITCGPFRSQSGNVEKLYRLYKDRATFVMVYVREAHPADGWSSETNFRLGITLAQPRTYEDRVAAAQSCDARISLGFPMLVDTMDDAVGGHYSGMPSRLYLIDRDGVIAYKSGRGPFGFKPAELEQSLLLLLQEGGAQGAVGDGRNPRPLSARGAEATSDVER